MSDEASGAPEQEVKPKKVRGKVSAPAPEGVETEGAATEAKEGKKRAARGSNKFAMDAKITLVAKENPKQPQSKSYIRFAEYVDKMTCKEAIDKGVYLADLYYDSQHGFISIDEYTPPPLERKRKEKVEQSAEKPATEPAEQAVAEG